MLTVFGFRTSLHLPTTERAPSECNLQPQSIRVLTTLQILIGEGLIPSREIGLFPP